MTKNIVHMLISRELLHTTIDELSSGNLFQGVDDVKLLM